MYGYAFRETVRSLRLVAWALPLAVVLVPVGMAALAACDAPESFDGLVGGPRRDAGDEDGRTLASTELVPDSTLLPPRPIAPISVSWVNGSRVRFKWQLGPEATGARVELCRTRTCEGEKKTFDAHGSELLTPEDLAPGIWFWRLYAETGQTFGTIPSASWEVLVRGGPINDGHATGSITDLNGDGKPDLLVTATFGEDDAGTPIVDIVPFLAGQDETSFAPIGSDGTFDSLAASENPRVAVADVDGDGFSDVVCTDRFGATSYGISTFFGARSGIDYDRAEVVGTPPSTEVFNLHEAGDLDGDGWGDVIVGTRQDIFTIAGTARGLGRVSYQFQLGPPNEDAGIPVLGSAMTVAGGFDRDGDGLYDAIFRWPLANPATPIAFLRGEREETRSLLIAPWAVGAPPKIGATAFASGDFDGDGSADTAFVTSIEGNTAVCIVRALAVQSTEDVECWSPAGASPGLGASLTACDVDADGRDELIVGSTSNGVYVLRRTDAGLVAERLETPFGARVTTIWPGRPGPAIWAATRSFGAEIAIFRGTAQNATIASLPGTKGFGPTIR